MDIFSYVENVNKKILTSPLYGQNDSIAKEISYNIEILKNKLNGSLHLAIIGEVKSGKSTLVNAFAGGSISPQNVSEATASIIKVSYSDIESASINYLDGSKFSGSIDEIYDELTKNINDQTYFKNCKDVEIYRSMSGLRNLFIIDTPGLATITEENETRTIDYFQDVDVVLWVFNGNYLGQSDINDYVRKVAGMGKPIVAVINRIDEVQADKEELIEYLDDSMGLYFDKIFPISAKLAFEGRSTNNEALIRESGFQSLYQYLEENIDRQASAVQEESVRNSIKVLEKQIGVIHQHALNNIELKLDLFDKIESKIDYATSSLKTNIERYISKWIYEEYLVTEERNIRAKFSDRRFYEKLPSETEVMDVVNASIRNGSTDIDIFVEKLNAQINELWKNSLTKVDEEFEEELNISIKSQIIEYQKSAEFVHLGVEHNGFQDSVMTAVAAGGALSVYAAVLGPAATHVSIGAALGGVMPPVLLAGAAVGVLKMYNDRKHHIEHLNDSVKSMYLTARKDLYKNFIDNIYQYIDELRDNTIIDVKDRFLKSNFNNMNKEDVYILKGDIERFLINTGAENE
ncbi:dynamin family protein [Veillonella agrestimuris]|uniref:dynamin family protein n=1 Tax=Veillonella agrestimuris TaxID=2941340 RepID=UPI00203D1BEB|nr:dynamin family protein [Veillonella agrestimuris]